MGRTARQQNALIERSFISATTAVGYLLPVLLARHPSSNFTQPTFLWADALPDIGTGRSWTRSSHSPLAERGPSPIRLRPDRLELRMLRRMSGKPHTLGRPHFSV